MVTFGLPKGPRRVPWQLCNSRMDAIQIKPMNYLQNWIQQLNPMSSLPSIAIFFLIASIASWYVG